MTPIHTMTEAEFDALPVEVRLQYPCHSGGAGPSHSNYYLCCLHLHIQSGGKVSDRVWESLSESERTHLAWIGGKK